MWLFNTTGQKTETINKIKLFFKFFFYYVLVLYLKSSKQVGLYSILGNLYTEHTCTSQKNAVQCHHKYSKANRNFYKRHHEKPREVEFLIGPYTTHFHSSNCPQLDKSMIREDTHTPVHIEYMEVVHKTAEVVVIS